MSNSSTPGFKAMKLQDHLHYTDFKNELLQRKHINCSTKKIVDAEEKANGNNVDSQEHIRQINIK
jgi:flagellar basal body rod protein FlgB